MVIIDTEECKLERFSLFTISTQFGDKVSEVFIYSGILKGTPLG
jgi:hypothetical protein